MYAMPRKRLQADELGEKEGSRNRGNEPQQEEGKEAQSLVNFDYEYLMLSYHRIQ